MYVLKVNFEHSITTSFGETMNTIIVAVVHCIIRLMVVIKVDFFLLMLLKRVKTNAVS